ncbi:AarF/ABC1/UbiB kinase family protein [Candidatus Woesearchaeota archaeon]|nr:AarF/ABC1/UbiB kinase family protein [Candidatus Woesearchaeota archaeon]
MSNVNSFKRASKVINVLAKQGLGYFVQEFGLGFYLPFHKRIKRYKKGDSIPVRLRKSMEELGGAYVKLGQLLSLRPDLVPQEYCVEFSKLLDQMPAFRYEQARKVIETELKKPINSIFKSFDKKPIGSASIAQVHKAKLKNGKQVVVKIQRPHVKEQFEADIQIMEYFAHKLDKYFKQTTVSPLQIVKEFERYTKNELNFLIEADNIEQFHDTFKKSTKIFVPKVYTDFTTDKVLVMDYIPGTKLSEIQDKLSLKVKQEIIKNIADAVFRQVLDKGLFHADLHPGNILILPGRKIALLDFGIVGRLDKELKRYSIDMIVALVNKDSRGVVRTLLKIGLPTDETNLEEFELDTDDVVRNWNPASSIRATQVLHRLFNVCVKNHIRMPADLILLAKALVTAEGTCTQLDPDFNFVEYAKPKIAAILKKENKPKAIIKRLLQKSRAAGDVLADLPEQTSELIERFTRKPLQLDISDTDIGHLGRSIGFGSNKLAYAILTAALLLSGSMLVDLKPKVFGYSIFSIFALSFAILLLCILTGSMIRERLLPYGLIKRR